MPVAANGPVCASSGPVELVKSSRRGPGARRQDDSPKQPRMERRRRTTHRERGSVGLGSRTREVPKVSVSSQSRYAAACWKLQEGDRRRERWRIEVLRRGSRRSGSKGVSRWMPWNAGPLDRRGAVSCLSLQNEQAPFLCQ